MLSHLGRVWSDGDAFVVVDRGLVQGWQAQVADYERLVVTALDRGEVEIGIGNGRGVLLGHEADEGPLEVFRVGDRELLALIVSYADQPDPEAMAEHAASISANTVATLTVHHAHIVFLRSAVPWSDARVVTEQPSSYARTTRARADIDALVVALPRGDYAVGRASVDHDRYGFDAWRIVIA